MSTDEIPPGASDMPNLYTLERRGLIELTGTDCFDWMHNFCTQDIKKMSSGETREAFCTNVKARVLAHVQVLRLEERLWLSTAPDVAPDLITHLDRYIITEDVTLRDLSAERHQFVLNGAQAAETASALVGNAPERSGVSCSDDGHLTIANVGWLGSESDFLLIANSALPEETAPQAARRSTQDWNEARIFSGYPLDRVDMSDQHLAPEVNRESETTSMTKGCYLGQEPIARIDAIGHTNRLLVRLESSEQLPVAPFDLSDASGTPVGTCTSANQHPQCGRYRGLGYVKRALANPGCAVSVVNHPQIEMKVID